MADPRRRLREWGLLLALTVAITTVFHVAHVPAALLLGPLVAGIAVAARGIDIVLPRWAAVAAQAVVGCLIAGSMAGALGPVVREHGLLFVALTGATIAVSCGLGYLLGRLGIVPGTVAIWGSMPGGAAAMVLMAEANGADARLVAVMVYTRVVTVTVAATALAALLGGDAVSPGIAVPGGASMAIAPVWLMPLVALAGITLAYALRWPAGTLILTMALGVALDLSGAPSLHVPGWLLVLAFAAIGWRIGLSFTGEARGAALHMLPRIVLASVLLVAFCGMLAMALYLGLGIDPLTAWLATSPGGLETVAVIASALPVDTPFIMAAQTARFALVMLVGPTLAGALARRSRRKDAQGAR